MALLEEFEQQGNKLFQKRSYLPIYMLVVGLLIFAFGQVFGQSFLIELLNFELIYEVSLAVSLLGLLVRIITVAYTPRNTSGRNTKKQVAEFLNSTGMYSLLRHPLYLGNYLMYLGIAMLTSDIYFVLIYTLVFWLYYERIMFAEEQFLRGKFGQDYVDWSMQTNAFFPKFFNWTKPNLDFSWKKIIKKEKNGLFALVLIFYIFETVSVSIRESTFTAKQSWLMWATIFTGVLYVVLRYIKKNTSLLNEEGR